MIQLLVLLTGVSLAVMISANGLLTQAYGVFSAALIVHLVGVGFALALCVLKKERIRFPQVPLWFYLGGVIGVLTTIFSNYAFSYLSLTSIVALELTGQTVTSLAIDHFGLIGMPKRPFQKTSLPGLAFAVLGILVMLDQSVTAAVLAVAFALGAGITVVLSRTVNARLAESTGALTGSLINHLAGLPLTLLLVLFLEPFPSCLVMNSAPWMYLGGALGVCVVLMCNLTVTRISAFRLTVLTFVGQIFTSLFLDVMGGIPLSGVSLRGGLIITWGLAVSFVAEAWVLRKNRSAPQ